MDLRELAALQNLVRIGKVSSANGENMTARVEFADKQNVDGQSLISGELKVIQTDTNAWLPHIGQLVVCLYLPKGKSDGFILGTIL